MKEGLTVYILISGAMCLWTAWLRKRDDQLQELLNEHGGWAWMSIVLFWPILIKEFVTNTIWVLRNT